MCWFYGIFEIEFLKKSCKHRGFWEKKVPLSSFIFRELPKISCNSKSGSPKGLEGSNPSLSVLKLHDSVSCSFLCFSDDMTILFSGRKMLYRTKKKRRYNQGFWKWRYRHYNRIYKNIVIDCVNICQSVTIFLADG